MNKPIVLTLEELKNYGLGKAAIWARSYLWDKLDKHFSLPLISDSDTPPVNLDTLIVIGGGILLDKAKVWRMEKSPTTKLIAVPSVWGSGSENSPVAILNDGTKKIIYKDDSLLPDFRVVWPELAKGIDERKLKYACGDVWAHSLEGFFSPIAGQIVRNEFSIIIKKLVDMIFSYDPSWFELSSNACGTLASSSAGLVHGIAHILEGKLNHKFPGEYFGHARLCSTYIWPVYRFNQSRSDVVATLFKQYGVEPGPVEEKIKQLYEDDFYDLILPVLKESWTEILREPSSRTNCVLVRAQALDYFYNKEFK
jgi:alcohol dehydrogenase class IV